MEKREAYKILSRDSYGAWLALFQLKYGQRVWTRIPPYEPRVIARLTEQNLATVHTRTKLNPPLHVLMITDKGKQLISAVALKENPRGKKTRRRTVHG